MSVAVVVGRVAVIGPAAVAVAALLRRGRGGRREQRGAGGGRENPVLHRMSAVIDRRRAAPDPARTPNSLSAGRRPATRSG